MLEMPLAGMLACLDALLSTVAAFVLLSTSAGANCIPGGPCGRRIGSKWKLRYRNTESGDIYEYLELLLPSPRLLLQFVSPETSIKIHRVLRANRKCRSRFSRKRCYVSSVGTKELCDVAAD
jgi:hypothetical protein